VLGARGTFPATVAVHRQQRERRRAASRPRYSRRERVVAALRLIPGRVLALLAAILTVGATSTAVFVVSDQLPLLDAMYFTATTMATVGYGDINLLGAPDWLKIYDIGLMAGRLGRAAGLGARAHHGHVGPDADRLCARPLPAPRP